HPRGALGTGIDDGRVLFPGGGARKAQPAFASPYSSLRQWFGSLDALEAFKPVLIVPSHGPNGEETAFISGYRAYLSEVRDRTAAEKKAGRNVDQAVEAVTEAPVARFPMRGRPTP